MQLLLARTDNAVPILDVTDDEDLDGFIKSSRCCNWLPLIIIWRFLFDVVFFMENKASNCANSYAECTFNKEDIYKYHAYYDLNFAECMDIQFQIVHVIIHI